MLGKGHCKAYGKFFIIYHNCILLSGNLAAAAGLSANCGPHKVSMYWFLKFILIIIKWLEFVQP